MFGPWLSPLLPLAPFVAVAPGPNGVAESRPLPVGRGGGAVSLVLGPFVGGGVGAAEDGAVLGASVVGFLMGLGFGGSGSRSIGVWLEGETVVGGWERRDELAGPVKGFGLGLYVGAGDTGAEVTDGGGPKRDT
jgi:hypothetical protein